MVSSPNTITLWIRESTYGFCGNTVHFIEETKQDISIRLFHDKTVIMAAIKLFQVYVSLTNLFITKYAQNHNEQWLFKKQNFCDYKKRHHFQNRHIENFSVFWKPWKCEKKIANSLFTCLSPVYSPQSIQNYPFKI